MRTEVFVSPFICFLFYLIFFIQNQLVEEHVQRLEKPIIAQEINWAITNLKLDQSPGVDSLTVKFYKNIYRTNNYLFEGAL